MLLLWLLVEDQTSFISTNKTILSIGRTNTQLSNWSGYDAPMYHWIFWICLFFIIIEINHLGKFPFISIWGILQNCNISSPKVSSRSQPVSPFLLGCQEVFTSPTPKFVAGVLYLSSMFFTVQITCPKHTRWGITTLLFIYNRWLGDSTISLFASLMVSTIKALELIITSTSANNCSEILRPNFCCEFSEEMTRCF